MALLLRVRAASSGWTGGPGLNTFYYVNAGDPTTATSSDAALAVTLVHDSFEVVKGIYPTATTIQVDGVVDVLTAATGELTTSFAVTPPALVTGTSDNGYGPIAAEICLSLLTSTVLDGRRVRGRAFLGPLQRDDDGNGSPTTAMLGLVQDFGDSLISGTGGVPHLVVWHRPKAGAGGGIAAVTATSTRDIFAVLRSRRD